MTTIETRQAELIRTFESFASWEEKYKYIIAQGKELQGLSEGDKVEKNRIKGCQSQTWLVASLNDKRVYYQADSDALIVKGLAAILLFVFSGATPDEILNANTDFLKQTGLTTHLSQSRANGLTSMLKQFKNYALAYKVFLEGSA